MVKLREGLSVLAQYLAIFVLLLGLLGPNLFFLVVTVATGGDGEVTIGYWESYPATYRWYAFFMGFGWRIFVAIASIFVAVRLRGAIQSHFRKESVEIVTQ